MTTNEKGFSAPLIFLVVLVIAIVGFAGYKVMGNRNEASKKTQKTVADQKNSDNVTADQGDAKQPTPASTKQEVIFNSAKYSVTLPQGWTYKNVTTVTNDEKLSYFTDPAKKVQLELQIIKRPQTAGQASAAGQIEPSNPFAGIDGKTYYLAGYVGSSKESGKFELIKVSADCQPWYCYTPINDDYSLNIAIRSADGTTPIAINDPLVEIIKNIISTIKLN